MIEYSIVRQTRKTISIIVKDATVMVKAPILAKQSQIDEFLKAKETWIRKKLAEYEERTARFAQVLNCESIMYRGKQFVISYYDKTSFKFDSDYFLVPKKHEINIEKLLKSWYKRQAKVFLLQRLQAISAYVNLNFQGLSLTGAKGKWGSCNTEKNIKLNWRLIMLPDSLIDYVIIHELCHTKHMNHSNDFWQEVQSFMPSYKTLRKQLKEYSVLIELLR